VSASRARSSYSGYETKEEEELRTECTFKPKINQNRNATPVRSKYMMPTQSSTALFGGDASQLDVTQGSVRQSHRLPSGMEECTFAPRTNPIPRWVPSSVLTSTAIAW
jgi:carotenoid cleavage dioxygenase-like enzyme